MTPRSRFQRNGHRRQLCASDICFSWRVGAEGWGVGGSGPPRAFDAALSRPGRGTAAAGRRLPVAPGRPHRYHHRDGPPHVPRLFKPGAVSSCGLSRRGQPGGRQLPGRGDDSGGRKPIRPDDPKVVSAKQLRKERSLSIDQICETLGIPHVDVLSVFGSLEVAEWGGECRTARRVRGKC